MPTTATLNLSGIIMPDDWIWYDESGISLPIVQRAIASAGTFDDLTIFINSDGGVIEEGWAIYDYLLSLGKPITTIGLGNVYSMATILMATGTTRLLSPHSKFMIHLPGGETWGNRLDIQEYLDVMVAEEKRLVDVYVSMTSKDEAIIAELLADGKDHYYTADESLAFGFTTGIYSAALAQPATARMSGRVPIMAHAREGRKGLGLPQHQSAAVATTVPPVATPAPVTPPTPAPNPLFDMTKVTNQFIAGLKSMVAAMTGSPLTALIVKSKDDVHEFDIETVEGSTTYATGDAITHVDATPVADGDYILTDDNTITVENGSITDVVEPVSEDDAAAAATAAAEEAAPTASAGSDPAETVTISKSEYDQLRGDMTAMKAEQTEQKKLNARMSAVMRGMSSADPIEPTLPETPADRAQPVAEPGPAERKAERVAKRGTL